MNKSSIVYTCTNRIYSRPKKYFYVSLDNNFLLFLWRPLSCGGPGQLPSPPLNPALERQTDRQTDRQRPRYMCDDVHCDAAVCVCVWWNVRGGGAANAVDRRTTTRAALTHNIVEADDDIFTDESAQQVYNTIIAHTGHADLPMCEHYTLQLCVMRGVIFRES